MLQLLDLFRLIVACYCFLLVSPDQTDPVPPAVWPPVWYTWVTVNVVDANKQSPIYTKGQIIAFDSGNSSVCRYQQQMLYPESDARGVDVCNWQSGNHYGIVYKNDIVNCTANTLLNTTLQQLVWPTTFLNSSKYMGTDHMAGVTCNHWVATNIIIDGKNQQMDVWTTVDKGYPCQMVLWEMDTSLHTTWSFDGFKDSIPPDADCCNAAKLLCLHPDWVCYAKRGLDPDALGEQLQWVCDPSILNCTAINPYGDHFNPNTLVDHCDWAFNTYYMANRATLGTYACDFGGNAELVPPNQPKKNIISNSGKQQSKRLVEKIEIQSYLSSRDLVCV